MKDKIALCFSGQPRNVIEAYPFIKKNILDVNPNIDIFYHGWWREEWNTNPIEGYRPGVKIFYKDLEYVLDKYKPVSYKIENDLEKTWPSNEYYTKKGIKVTGYANRTHPMFYSAWMSNELKKIYSIHNNIKYDWVIRMRLDYWINMPINLDILDYKKIHVPTLWDMTQGELAINDQFAVGNNTNMDYYFSIYNELEKLANQNKEFLSEFLLGTHLKNGNIPVNFSWKDKLEVSMIRDKHI